jgi:hypothetical protein
LLRNDEMVFAIRVRVPGSERPVKGFFWYNFGRSFAGHRIDLEIGHVHPLGDFCESMGGCQRPPEVVLPGSSFSNSHGAAMVTKVEACFNFNL